MQPQQFAKLTFSDCKHNADPMDLHQAWKKIKAKHPDLAWNEINLNSDEAQDFMRDVLKEFETRVDKVAAQEAQQLIGSNGSPLAKDSSDFHDLKQRRAAIRTTDFDMVTRGVGDIIARRAAHDDVPRGIFPKMDAELDKQREAQEAAKQATKDEIRDNAIVNAAIETKVEEHMKATGLGYGAAKGELSAKGEIPGKKSTSADRAAWYNEQIEGPKEEQGIIVEDQQQERQEEPVLETMDMAR